MDEDENKLGKERSVHVHKIGWGIAKGESMHEL